MKSERIINALGQANDKYVEEAAPISAANNDDFDSEGVRTEPVTVAARKRRYGGRVAAAACLCAAVGGLAAWGVFVGWNGLSEGGSTQNPGQTQDVDPSGENTYPEQGGYNTVFLSREELYNCPWHMFLPRYIPEGYVFDGKASYTPTSFFDDSVITYRFTHQESGNSIGFIFTSDFLGGSYMEAELNLTRLTASDMNKIKSGEPIYCENGGSVLKVDIDDPELVTNEEIYKTLMSIPASDNFAASGIATVDLSEYIGDGIPTVAFEQFYDIRRVKIRTRFNERDSFPPFFDAEANSAGGADGEFGTIVGFDGKNVYFVNEGTTDSTDENGNEVSLSFRTIGMYDILNDSYTQLVRQYEGDMEFIYADGKAVYFVTGQTDGNKVLHSTFHRLYINDISADSSLLTVDGVITDTAVNGSSIYFATGSEGQYALVHFDTQEDVMADIAANKPYVSMTAVPGAIERIMPYKEGVAFILQKDTKSCYYWNGGQESGTELLFKAENDAGICSDGEIFYAVTDGQLFTGTDYTDQSYSDKQFFNALDILGLSVTDMVTLTYNNGVDSDPLYAFDPDCDMAIADGLIVPSPCMGIIYDARNGWFTHVDPDKNYRSRSSAGSSLLLLEEDESYGQSYTGEMQDDRLTLCIIMRK